MNSVLEWLDRAAERFPEKTAFADADRTLSFSALREGAWRTGTALARIGVIRKPVALLMEKSLETICLMLGAVSAGGFYAVLDPSQPEERLNRMLETLQAPVLIAGPEEEALSERLRFDGLRLSAGAVCACEKDEALLEAVRAQRTDVDPLYLIYTSGSTGSPKGVLVSHRSVIDFIEPYTRIFGITQEDVLGNQAPWDFDVSVKDIYGGLCTGAAVQLIPRALFSVPVQLLDFLEEKGVTSLTWAVSALAIVSALDGLSYRAPVRIRRILFSGEAMPVRHLNYWRRYYPHALFANLYGPTEITCNCTYYIVDREFAAGETIPIGRPFPNETVFLLDETGKAVTTPGAEGEICVGGTALALGYYRAPEQTAAAFVQNPLNPDYPERIYRTGDIGCYNERGELCFAARRDHQIKHMGHRIELGEIEHALEKIEAVRRSCVLFDREKGRIWCFYQGEIDRRSLARQLGTYLPAYMVPGTFRQLEALPLNKNGKTDRAALKALMAAGGRARSGRKEGEDNG